VIRSEVVLEDDVLIEDSIVLDSCVIGRGARIRRAIIDRHNFVPPGAQIGYDTQADSKYCTVTPSGIAVMPLAPLGQRRHRFGP
jgi:glucose-1-phosphate adenylyltransferase